MRGSLLALANGKVSRTGPLLQFSADKVEIEVLEGQKVQGEFSVAVLNDKKLRGVVYTTGLRMNCLTPQFEGTSATIRYEYDSTGMHEGNIEKGYFSLVCNQCEYSLSFVVTVVRPYALSMIGRIRTTADFAHLAEENWEEAKRIYRSGRFRGLFKEGEEKDELLYRMLSPGVSPGNSMNEFLTATGRKDQNSFSLSKDHADFQELTDLTKERLEIITTGFGHFYAAIRSDEAFLVPLRTEITEDDLMGKRFQLEYMVDVAKLHAGQNTGHIIIENFYHTETYTVTASLPAPDEAKRQEWKTAGEIRKGRMELTRLYVDYRLKRMVTGEWAKKTVNLCRHLEALEPDNPWWKLIQAQAYLVNRQKQDARWILDAYRRERVPRNASISGYYLYLCTLSEREKGYVDKLTAEVEDLYRVHPDSLVLFWIRLFLREELMDSDSRRLDTLKLRYDFGAHSPFLYLEAYFLLHQDPALISHLDSFEIRVLYWAARQKVLTKDLVMQISALTSLKKDYDPVLVRLLRLAYEAFPGEDLVLSACSYLIRCSCYGKAYFFWYDKGVDCNLRITGLAEAYLLSMDENEEKELPKVIQMYFRYESMLPVRKVALLFAKVVREKEKNRERYQNFRHVMESFAMDQMNEGRIDENLAVIYHDLLKDGLINREIASAMERLMFSFLVYCPNPRVKALHIRHMELNEEETVPVQDHKAVISLYTQNYCIVAEDETGRRYSALGADLEIRALMRPHDYLKRCMERAGLCEKYVLYDISRKEHVKEPLLDKKEELDFLLSDQGISDAYKAKLLPMLLRVFGEEERPELILKYLRQTRVELMDGDAAADLAVLLIEKRFYDEAYRLIRRIGPERIDPAKLVPLLTQEIRERDYEEDDYLRDLTFYTFTQKKYNEEMLTYLSRHLNAPSEDLADLYRASKVFGVETFDLAERLLTQELFSYHMESDAFDVFRDYLEQGGRELVIHAYLNYTADAYFVREIPADKEILDLLRRRDDRGEDETDIEKLAVLFFLSKDSVLAEAHHDQTERLLSELLSRGMVFPFYLNLPHDLVEKYQLYDRTFLEFRTDPDKQVYVHYSLSDHPEDFQVQEMQHMYGGIFVCTFILFFGESVQYYITEEDNEMQKVAGSGEITKNDVYGSDVENRFDALNAILLHGTLKEEEALVSAIRSYESKTAGVKSRFTIL